MALAGKGMTPIFTLPRAVSIQLRAPAITVCSMPMKSVIERCSSLDQPGWLVYFSFTTLTTVGFGDVLPAKAFARSLSVLEAVIGQIMLVVMMARLVGLHVAHATSSKSHPVEFSTDEG